MANYQRGLGITREYIIPWCQTHCTDQHNTPVTLATQVPSHSLPITREYIVPWCRTHCTDQHNTPVTLAIQVPSHSLPAIVIGDRYWKVRHIYRMAWLDFLQCPCCKPVFLRNYISRSHRLRNSECQTLPTLFI